MITSSVMKELKCVLIIKKSVLTLIKIGLFGVAHKWRGGGAKRPPSLKSFTHAKMMKLGRVKPYLKKTQKIYE